MPTDPAANPGPEPLTVDQVRKVAKLSRLALTDAQAEEYRSRLSGVLGYVERLRTLDLSNVEPMAHPMETTNRLGNDEPGSMLTNAVFMGIAPDTHPPFVKVPKVIGEGSA